MVVVALLSVDLVESVDLVSVELVVNCSIEGKGKRLLRALCTLGQPKFLGNFGDKVKQS